MKATLAPAACLLAALVLLQALAPAAAAQTRSGQQDAETAIRSLWSALDTHWNYRDVEGFAALFTADADFHFVGRGESLNGRRAIERRFAVQFPQMAEDVRHSTTVEELRDLGAGLYTVDCTVRIKRVQPDDSAPPAVIRTFSVFGVMLRTDAGWRIRSLRAYQLSPESGTGDERL